MKRLLFMFIIAGFIVYSYFSSIPVYADEKGRDLVIVSLGDSYSSGEGNEPFYDQELEMAERVKSQDWLAHRSRYAWGGMLSLPGVKGNMGKNRNTHWIFAASSGAETKHLSARQNKAYYKEDGKYSDPDADLVPQLDVFNSNAFDYREKLNGKKADYVTLTLGGNDLGFSEIITTAAKCPTFLSPCILNDVLDEAEEKLDKGLPDKNGNRKSVRDKLGDAYQMIADKAGEQAKILVGGYPKLFDVGRGFLNNRRIFTYVEAAMINNKVKYFNSAIKEVVEYKKQEGVNIEFVDVEDEFDPGISHGAFGYDPWINGVMLYGNQEITEKEKMDQIISSASFHPNRKGQEAYARCFQKAINKNEGIEMEIDSRIADDNPPDGNRSRVSEETFRLEYLKILKENVDQIWAYDWQYNLIYIENHEVKTDWMPPEPIAFYDFTGDGVPELFYLTADSDGAILHIVTCDPDGTRELGQFETNVRAGAEQGDILFAKKKENAVYLFSANADDFMWQKYTKIEVIRDKQGVAHLKTTDYLDLYLASAEHPEDDSWKCNGKKVSKEEYEKKEDALINKCNVVILYNSNYEGYFRPSIDTSNAISVTWYRAMYRMQNPLPTGTPKLDDELCFYLGTDYYHFVESGENMRDQGATDGYVVYSNDFISVGSNHQSEDWGEYWTDGKIKDIWIKAKCRHSLYGIKVGTTDSDAKGILEGLGYKLKSDEVVSGKGSKTYVLPDVMTVYLKIEQKKVKEIWCSVDGNNTDGSHESDKNGDGTSDDKAISLYQSFTEDLMGILTNANSTSDGLTSTEILDDFNSQYGTFLEPDAPKCLWCYSRYDLNDDGNPELILYKEGPEGLWGYVAAVLTIEGDDLKIVLTGWDRNRYYIDNDGLIYNYGSDGAEANCYVKYKMVGSQLEMIDCVCEEWGTYYRSNTDGFASPENRVDISESEYHSICSDWDNHLEKDALTMDKIDVYTPE